MSRISSLKLIAGALLIAACACPRSHPRVHPKPQVTIFAVADGRPGDARCRWLDDECLILKEDPPPVRLTAYQVAIEDRNSPTLTLELSVDDAVALEALSRSALGGRLAVAVDGRIVHAPKVREPLKGAGLQLSYCGRERFEDTRAALFPVDAPPR